MDSGHARLLSCLLVFRRLFIIDPHTHCRLFDKEGIHLHGHPSPQQPDNWYPYNDRVQLKLSASQIDAILQLWSITVDDSPSPTPFKNHKDMYQTIDQTPLGDIPWNSFSLKYNGEKLADDVPQWMDASFEICYRDPCAVIHNMLGHPGFKDDMDYVPYCEYTSSGEWLWQDFMSGDWAWMQADEIAKDPTTHGSTFVPVILSSDKTVVSVATGHTEYWPLYMSIGNVHNHLCRAHKGALVVIGFLSILKTKKKHASSSKFHKFKRKLFHTSIAKSTKANRNTKILQPLCAAMTVPELVWFGDGHYQWVIYSLGPYIVDYEEQVLLACIVRGWCGKCTAFPDDLDTGGLLRSREHLNALFEKTTTNIMWDQYGVVGNVLPFMSRFPRPDIYKLLAPDLLHQLIKGVFKDHLVAWVEVFLKREHGTMCAQEIMDDIDKCISVVPPFSHLRCFPQGRGFEKWTGNDLKVLMKVYLLAIEGHLPSSDVHCFQAFHDFCYIAHSDIISEWTLKKLEAVLRLFHHYRTIFQDAGIRCDISLPRQHSMMHYAMLICLFGAPNGLSIIQMLQTIQWLLKLLAARADFRARGMMKDPTLDSHADAQYLPLLISHFPCEQLDDSIDHEDPHHTCPRYTGQVHVFNHAIATFRTPIDPSNNNSMRDEIIRAAPLWQKGMPRYNCIFINSDNELHGMRGMEVARVICFFSFEMTSRSRILTHVYDVDY
ncbi:hypothetical protein EI94DRAFT_1774396 [Lactarius quietus]|nr:hypothetical protein EI94DRAFT_1774396 [Lactarius quietus]